MVTGTKVKKCPVCNKRPALEGDYCQRCAQRIQTINSKPCKEKPVLYMHYKGYVIAWFKHGDKVQARRADIPIEKLPAKITLDLGKWCEGYTRDKIKAFKAEILRLNHA